METPEILETVPAVRETDPVEKPLELLRDHGVAVLVNKDNSPVNILTYCDVDEASRKATELVGQPDAKAARVFPERNSGKVKTVKDTDRLSEVAKKVAEANLATGITVVDRRGAYKGYIFASALREGLRAGVEQGRKKLAQLKRDYPGAAPEIDRLSEQLE